MRITKIFELTKLKDVVTFCNTLVRLKRQAPKSLKLMIAVTAEQETEIVYPEGVDAAEASYVERVLAGLQKPPKRVASDPAKAPKKKKKKVKKKKPEAPKPKVDENGFRIRERPKSRPRRTARPNSTVIEI